MNTNTCLIGSSLVNNVNLLENAYCTYRGSWKPRRWMLNENIVDNMVSLLGEYSGQLLEYSIIGNTFVLFGLGIIKNELTPEMVFISALGVFCWFWQDVAFIKAI
jgi:hypothetical protein